MSLIRNHLTRLFDLAGRENRRPFWLWYLAVYVALTVLNGLVMVPLMIWTMSGIDLPQPSSLTGKPVAPDPALIFVQMMPAMRLFMGFALVVTLVQLLLIGAAAVRRLHDRGWAGWWLVPQFVVQPAALIAMFLIFPYFLTNLGGGPTDLSGAPFLAMGAFGLLSIVQWAVLIGTVVLLCLPGTVGPNRYGPDPLEGQRLPTP